jgi:cytochrome P450
VLDIVAVNRDPEVFCHLVNRGSAKNVSLGSARHPCFGGPLARLQAETADLVAASGDRS